MHPVGSGVTSDKDVEWRVQRGVTLAAFATLIGCGGQVESDRGIEGEAGTDGLGDLVPCPALVPPLIEFEPTCDEFVPALGPTMVGFVERTTTSASSNRIAVHRFSALAECGFDVLISLPDATLAADEAPYEMSTWWSWSGGLYSLPAVVLRRPGDRTPLLGVATEGSLDLLDALVGELAVAMRGPPCDIADAAPVKPVLTREDAPLSCTDEAPRPLRLCHDGSTDYHLLSYSGLPDSTTVPAVFGAAALLSPLDR